MKKILKNKPAVIAASVVTAMLAITPAHASCDASCSASCDAHNTKAYQFVANPCAAKNPCAASNPCAAKNPCAASNPCAAN